MKLLRLFPVLTLVAALIFLPACAPEAETETFPEAGEEAVQPGVEQEIDEVQPEVEQDIDQVQPEVEQEVNEFDQRFSQLQGYTFEQRDQFVNDLNTWMQDYDTRISELEAQAAQADEATGAQLNESVTALRQQRDMFQQQLDQVGAATAENWDNLKLGVMAAIESFEQSLQEAESNVG
jgi:hypothetical protein